MSLITSLSIARQGLNIAQLGLQTTSQNVSNVNTQGYKRQQVVQANLPYGLGVTASSIDRIRDPFAEKRLLQATTSAAKSDVTSQAYSDLESLFDGDLNSQGLDTEFKDFFKSLQDLATTPSGTAERSTLVSQGDSIGRVFSFLSGQMEQQSKNQDSAIAEVVSEVNGLVKDIANLNNEIGISASNPLGVNELKNDRDESVRKLSELIPITTNEDKNGNFSVYIQQGMPLVSAADYYQLEVTTDPKNDLKSGIEWVTKDGIRQDVTAQMTDSKLGGILKVRDEILPAQMAQLDSLAAEFVKAFNEQHRAGTGLDGVSGRNFFEEIPVYSHMGLDNTGGVAVTASSVTNPSLLTLDDYEIQFSVPGGPGTETYNVIDKKTGATVASGAYTSGAALTFDGISVTLSNSPAGPADGDVFEVDTVTHAAQNIKISAAVTASLDAIAAGGGTSATGDNRNALLMADLENKRVAAGGTMSFVEMNQAMIVKLGAAASSEKLQSESQDTLLNQTTNLVDGVSGVNVDEEATNLMQYQYAYQAASKVITVTDEMLKTLLSII